MLALIHRKRRKTHLAASIDATQQWAPLCDVNPVPYSLVTFTGIAAGVGTVQPDDTTVCVHCRRMIAFVHILNRLDHHTDGGRHLTLVKDHVA